MTVSRALAMPFILLIRVYQTVVSPLRPQTCRYYPSCSAYAVTSFERFGPFRGLWLAGRRLLRCHPWTPGGVDHVPLGWGEPAPDWRMMATIQTQGSSATAESTDPSAPDGARDGCDAAAPSHTH